MPEAVSCPTPHKVAHASPQAAWAALRALRRSRPLGQDWNVYQCRCRAWHIGHKPGSLSGRIRRAIRPDR